MPMRIPTGILTECLPAGDHTGRDLPARRFAEILRKQTEDMPAQLRVQRTVVLEIHAQAFRDGEDELPVGQLQQQIFAQVLAQKQSALLAAGGAQEKTLA